MKRPFTGPLFAALFLFAGLANASVVAEIADRLGSLSAVHTNSRIELKFESLKPLMDEGIESISIWVDGPVPTQETKYLENSAKEAPYSRIVERYSTSGFESFRQGGRLKTGSTVNNEAEIYSREQPVIGLALFASKFHQSRLLHLLKNPEVLEMSYDGNAAFSVSGEVRRENFLLRVNLVFSKGDYHLLEQRSNLAADPTAKAGQLSRMALLKTERQNSNEPSSMVSCEVWSKSNLVQHVNLPFSVRHSLRITKDDREPSKFPEGTIVSDKRFGYGVVYESGKYQLTDEDIAKMSTDPDFRTNDYYRKHFQLLQEPSVNPSKPRAIFFVLLLLFLCGPMGLLWIWRKSKNTAKRA